MNDLAEAGRNFKSLLPTEPRSSRAFYDSVEFEDMRPMLEDAWEKGRVRSTLFFPRGVKRESTTQKQTQKLVKWRRYHQTGLDPIETPWKTAYSPVLPMNERYIWSADSPDQRPSRTRSQLTGAYDVSRYRFLPFLITTIQDARGVRELVNATLFVCVSCGGKFRKHSK